MVSFVKKNINNSLKKTIDQYMHDTIQVFQIWHNLCSELTNILAIHKQPTNRPNLKNQKYLEISKYKRLFSLERP